MTTGARRQPSAEGRKLERLRKMTQRQPVGRQRLLDLRTKRPALDSCGQRNFIDLDQPVDVSHVERNDPTEPRPDIWIDSTDNFSGNGNVHAVAAFAGGISKSIGVSLADPGDSGSTLLVNLSLWGSGPVAGDVNQGEVGDCYFVASLAAFAGVKPSMLQESAVDLGDGTFAVQFFQGGAPVYVRVASDFAVGGFSGYKFAHPGSNNTIWAAVMEKAFCYFRTGDNIYASISSGWMGDVYADLGVNSTAFFSSNYDEGSLFNMLSNGLAGGNAITLGTVSPPDLVADHAYTLISVSRDATGATHYVVRNPWGESGDSLEDNQGYATLNFTQFVNNFYDGCLQIS